MSVSLVDALRERLELRPVLVWLALMAGLYFLGTPPLQLATTTVMSGVIGLCSVIADSYDLRESVRHVGFGAAMVLGGGGLLVFDESSVLLPVTFLLLGGWCILDSVQTVRHEGVIDPEVTRDGHDVYHDYVARRVHETLKERSQTRRELGESLDADDEAIDMAIERLLDRDVIKRTGSEFRVSLAEDRSSLDHAYAWVAGMVRRIARPITIEFERDTSDSTRVDQEDDASWADQSDRNSSDSHDVTDSERNREPADESL